MAKKIPYSPETQFKKGQTGNPNGRPLGVKNRSTVLRKWLDISSQVKNPETGQIETGTVEDKVVIGLVAKGIKGDVNAIREILDSVYGKAQQNIHATGSLQLMHRYILQPGNDPINGEDGND